MGGSRIRAALAALELFIRSITQNSKFNVISFGSTYQLLYEKSVEYNNANMENAIKEIKTFSSDLGGTELYSPINYALSLESDHQWQKICLCWVINQILRLILSNRVVSTKKDRKFLITPLITTNKILSIFILNSKNSNKSKLILMQHSKKNKNTKLNRGAFMLLILIALFFKKNFFIFFIY